MNCGGGERGQRGCRRRFFGQKRPRNKPPPYPPPTHLHRLGALRAELARDDHFAPLGARLHHVAEHAVARAAHREPAEQLVPQRLGLRHRAQPPVGHLFRVELDRAVGEAKPFLDGGRELAHAAPLDAEHVLRARGADDDLGAHGGHADLDAGVALGGGRGVRGRGAARGARSAAPPRGAHPPPPPPLYLLGQLAGEELVELGVEDAVGDELFFIFFELF